MPMFHMPLRCLEYSTLPLAAKIGLVASFGSSMKVLKVYYSSNTINQSTLTRARYEFNEEKYPVQS